MHRSLVRQFPPLRLALSALALCCTGLAGAQPAASRPATPVEIVAPQPVPVTVTGGNGTVGVTGRVTIGNTTTNPVPVAITGARPWLGTPKIVSTIVLNREATGFEVCERIYTAAAGEALLLKTVVGRFNVPPNTAGSMRVRLTAYGSTEAAFVPVPAAATAPSLQVAGLYPQFAGSFDGGDLPIIAADACLSGLNGAGSTNLIGFVVPAPTN